MDRAEREKELDKIRRKLRAGVQDLEVEDDEAVDTVALSGEPVKEVIEGECYYVPSLGQTGVAESSLSKSGTVNILCGSMKIAVKKNQLMMPTKAQRDEFLRGKNKGSQKGKVIKTKSSGEDMGKVRFNAASTTRSELMLIGMTTAEAVVENGTPQIGDKLYLFCYQEQLFEVGDDLVVFETYLEKEDLNICVPIECEGKLSYRFSAEVVETDPGIPDKFAKGCRDYYQELYDKIQAKKATVDPGAYADT